MDCQANADMAFLALPLTAPAGTAACGSPRWRGKSRPVVGPTRNRRSTADLFVDARRVAAEPRARATIANAMRDTIVMVVLAGS